MRGVARAEPDEGHPWCFGQARLVRCNEFDCLIKEVFGEVIPSFEFPGSCYVTVVDNQLR